VRNRDGGGGAFDLLFTRFVRLFDVFSSLEQI